MEVEANTDAEACELAFAKMQTIDEGRMVSADIGCRSASCGDVFAVNEYIEHPGHEARYYVCSGVGFKRLESKYHANEWLKKSFRDSNLDGMKL